MRRPEKVFWSSSSSRVTKRLPDSTWTGIATLATELPPCVRVQAPSSIRIELLVAGTPCGFFLGLMDPSDCCTYSIETLFLLSLGNDHDDAHSSSLSSCPDMCLALSACVHGSGPVWRISRITSRARSSCASSCHLNRSGPVSADTNMHLGRVRPSYPPAGSLEPCRCLTTARLSLGQAVDPEEPAPSPRLSEWLVLDGPTQLSRSTLLSYCLDP